MMPLGAGTVSRDRLATAGAAIAAVVGTAMRALADRAETLADLVLGAIGVFQLAPHSEDLYLLGLASQIVMFAIVFFLFAPRAFPAAARPVTDRTSFRLLVVVVGIGVVMAVPHRVIAAALAPFSGGGSDTVRLLWLAYAVVAAACVFTLYAGWLNDWRSLTSEDAVASLTLVHRGGIEPMFARRIGDRTGLDWLADVVWYGEIGATTGLRCVVFGLVAGLLALFEPVPELLVVAGSGAYLLRDRVPDRIDRRIPRIRDPEEFLYASVAVVGRGGKSTAAAGLAHIGFATAATPLLFRVPAGAEGLGSWSRLGVTACLYAAVLYAFWFWIRTLIRLPRFVSWWEGAWDHDRAPTLAIPEQVTRPLGLLAPATVPLVFVAQFVHGDVGVTAFGLVWPAAVGIVLLSVVLTRWVPAQPASSEEYAVPVSLGLYIAVVWLLVAGGPTVAGVVLPRPASLLPLVALPAWYIAFDSGNAWAGTGNRPAVANERGGWYKSVVDGGSLLFSLSITTAIGFMLLGGYATAVLAINPAVSPVPCPVGDQCPIPAAYYAVGVGIGLVGGAAQLAGATLAGASRRKASAAAAWITIMLIAVAALSGVRTAASVSLFAVVSGPPLAAAWRGVNNRDIAELFDPSGWNKVGWSAAAAWTAALVVLLAWSLVGMEGTGVDGIGTVELVFLWLIAAVTTQYGRGRLSFALPCYSWLLVVAFVVGAAAGSGALTSSALLQYAAVLWAIGVGGCLWLLQRVDCGHRIVAGGAVSLAALFGGAALLAVEPYAVDAVLLFGWLGLVPGAWAVSQSWTGPPVAETLGVLAGGFGAATAAAVIRPAAGPGLLAAFALVTTGLAWRRRLRACVIDQPDHEHAVGIASAIAGEAPLQPETKRRLRLLVLGVGSGLVFITVALLVVSTYATDVELIPTVAAGSQQPEPVELPVAIVPSHVPGALVGVSVLTAVAAVSVYSYRVATRARTRRRFAPGLLIGGAGSAVFVAIGSTDGLLAAFFGAWLLAIATTRGATGRLRYALAGFYVLVGLALAALAALAAAGIIVEASTVTERLFFVAVLLGTAVTVSLVGVAAAATQLAGERIVLFEKWENQFLSRWLY
jgi:hypothetical protein